MTKNFKLVSLVLSLMLSFSVAAFGQRTYGNIEGTVTDPNGAVVPNATVTAASTGTTAGFNRTITTDENGKYIFSQVPIGTYRITVTGSGFKTAAGEVNVVLDKNAQFNPALEVGSSSVTVDVIADSSVQIDPTNTKIDTNITKQVIEALPKGTTFTSLLKTAPNVRPEPLAAGFQIDGASGAENVFVIDGQEVTNFRTGQLNANNNLPFELVQEVQIKSTGFEAEYGGATGGVINVVTIGGNDQIRGNFGLSFRPQKLQGGLRPVINRYGTGAGQYEYFTPNKLGGNAFFPTGSLSGPIVKGKLWFSAIYAPQVFEYTQRIDYFNQQAPTGRTVTQTLDYTQRQVTQEALIRLDAQPHSKLRMYGTFLWNPISVEGTLPGNTEGLSGVPQEANFGGSIGRLVGPAFLGQQGGRQNSNNVNGQVTWTPTQSLVLNFRGGRTFLNEKLGSYGIPRGVRYSCSTAGDPTAVAGSNCVAGFTNFANNFQIDYDVSTRTTFDADASIINLNFLGRNNLKFGTQYQRLSNTTSQGYADTGVIVLRYASPISALTGQTPTPGNLGSGYIQRFGTIGAASSSSLALFAQDTLQIGRATFNLGIRAEKEDVPSFTTEGAGIQFNFGDKIAPRLGFAFDVTGDGKNKLFASYGWFYDRFKYELPRGSFGGDFYRRDYFEILPSRGAAYSAYTRANILGTTPDKLGGNCPGGDTGVNAPLGNGYSVCQFDFRIPSNLVGQSAIDPDLKAARQSEYTIGFERQIARNLLGSVRYTHKQIDHAVEDVGTFNAQGSEAYIIGNPGEGQVCKQSQADKQPCVKAVRDYDAVEFRIDKRATRYFFNASYTWSKLFGNYSGLASSDEAGRSSPNVNRFFDLPFTPFAATGVLNNARLATDRPHVFKAFGGYDFNWGGSKTNSTTISAFTTIQSGTPLTTIYTLYGIDSAILNGRGDLGRTEMYTSTDLSVRHRYKFGRDARFVFEPFLDILNLFNEDNVLGVQTTISGADIRAAALSANGCTVCTSEGAVINYVVNGGNIQQAVLNYLKNPSTSAANRTYNTYGQPNNFQEPRSVRFGARLFF